ncbi:hypothetical protein [Sphingomonas sp. GM_Shp_2]|uniref:hypothetical protein n=1 Tax=Sphingomonas sp. GM_Shp_2 TaxID=2937380 RepID=UPI00226AFC57|nr:hypothetical protein [Sphingomonas sp. GM_Shp_2]
MSAAWLGYGAISHSLANALRSSSPERAYQLAPGDGQIAAAFASNLSGPEATRQDRARADALARAALRRDPVTVPALSTLGLNAQIRGDTAAARRAFAYAQKLTRRDLRTQLWAIEDAVARGNIPEALKQYDLALRTAREAPDLLFPVLASAIEEPSVRRELVRMLARQPPWGGDFVIHAAAVSPDPQATVALLNGMRDAGISVPASASARVVDALLTRGDAEAAWRYYTSLYPGIERRKSRDPRFTARRVAPARFDWIPVDDPNLTATLEPSDAGGRFDFAASPGKGGAVLRQTQVLLPGDYVIEGVASVEQADTPPPYWVLSCASGSELGRLDVAPTGKRFAGSIRVPSGCPIQVLALVVRPSERLGGVAGQVTEARVRPAPVRP